MSILNKENKKNIYNIIIGFIVLAISSVGLAYYWKVAYEVDYISNVNLTIYITLFLSIIYFFAIAIFTFCKNNSNLKTVLLVFLAGLVFVFAGAPLQVPDEIQHFLRCYALSEGHFDFNGTRVFEGDIAILEKSFPAAFLNYHNYDNSIISGFENYYNMLSESIKKHEISEAFNFQILPYIFQVICILIGKLFSLSALGLMYASRIGGLILYCLISYFALNNCDRYKPVFIAVMFLPISIYVSASSSYESLIISSAYLLVSYYCKNTITIKDLPLIIFAVSVSAIKLPHLILIAIILFIPKNRIDIKLKGKKIPKWVIILIGVVATIVVYYLMTLYVSVMKTGYPPTERWNPDVNIMGQIEFILKNPFAYVSRLVLTLYENSMFFNGLGEFGYLDVHIPMISYLSVISLFIASFFAINKNNKEKTFSIYVLLGFIAMFVAIIMTALYVTWTPVSMIRVIGLQVRYFLPVIPLLFITISYFCSKLFKPLDNMETKIINISNIIPFIVAIISGVLVFQHYFIGPF